MTERNKFYIFLDIDGVIATGEALRKVWLSYTDNIIDINNDKISKLDEIKINRPYTSMFNFPFDTRCIDNFHKLQVYLSYRLNLEPITVISSSWRSFFKQEELDEVFRYKGLHIHKIEGYTKYIEGGRGKEIQTYLDEHSIKNNYIVLDDECNYDIIPEIAKSKCVNTKFSTGFSSIKYKECVRKINKIIKK